MQPMIVHGADNTHGSLGKSISYKNPGHGIPIPLYCFVVEEYFLTYCSEQTAVGIVGQGAGAHLTKAIW